MSTKFKNHRTILPKAVPRWESEYPRINLAELATGWDWADELEASRTIIHRIEIGESGNLVTLDALRNDGWFRAIGIECDEAGRNRIIEQTPCERVKRRVSKTTTVVIPSSIPFEPKQNEPKPPAWIKSPVEILTRLESDQTSADELETALLVAEITDFGDELIERLLVSLEKYISATRFTNDDDTMVMLSCAIRKYAMNMDASHFNNYAKWLHPTETKYLDSRIEMELVKGVDWRISYEPISLDDEEIDGLVNTIEEICFQYSTRRLLLQSNFASTALEANVSLILLLLVLSDKPRAQIAMTRAKQLDPDWIAEMIVDQLEESAGYIAENGDEDLSQAIKTLLMD